jgi:hypothetical protein
MKDFFISYNSADRFYAAGIRAWLENAGYSVIMQQGDFHAGSNFVLEMDEATKSANRMIAVLSPDYLLSQFAAPEWAAMFAKDPTGKERRLVPVRIRECELKGLLRQIVHIDLVGLSVNDAEKKLLAELAGNFSAVPKTPKKPKRAPVRSMKNSTSIFQRAKGDGNLQVGGDLNINSTKKVQNVIKPGPDEISQKQRAQLLRKIKQLGERDELAGRGKTYSGWMDKFKNAFNLDSYHLLKANRFDEALGWVKQQKAMTRPRLRRTDNEKWRHEHYGIIWGTMRTLRWQKQHVYDFALERGVVKKPITSLTELKERQLEELSDLFKSLARKKKPH